jgi:hypothetical protein
MKTFIIEYIDGKEIAIEADFYEEHDNEFLFGHLDSTHIDRVRVEYIRGIREARPVKTRGGGSY